MSLLWLEPLVQFLSLEDIARISGCSRVLRSKVKLKNVTISAAEFKKIVRYQSSTRFFRRVIDPAQLYSVDITLDPCEPQRAALLKILRSFTRCRTHERTRECAQFPASISAKFDDHDIYAFGYESALMSLSIRALEESAVSEGHLKRTHMLFSGFCEDDRADEKRLYCPCVDWAESCVHEGTLYKRESTDPRAHANWMCWLLKDDWYNIFRWFPKLATLSLPLSHRRSDPTSTGHAEYVPMIEFMFPRLGVKHGSKRGSCHHPGLRRLTLENISDYTLMIDETSECPNGATELEHLSLTCLAETSRRVLGSFVRNIVAAQPRPNTSQLIDLNLRSFHIQTAPQAIYYCTSIRTVAEADVLNRSLSATSDPASQNSTSESLEYGENLHRAKELYRRLALTFSTLLAVHSDKLLRCDNCGSTTCRSAKIRNFAPLIFQSCHTLTIDACSLLAQEDLPHAFPNLRTINSSIWISGELDVSADAAKAHFVSRIISLLKSLRSLTLVTIDQTLNLKISEELVDHSFDVRQHSIAVERERCPHRELFIKSAEHSAYADEYESIWLVLPVLDREGSSSQPTLVLMTYDEKLLSPFVKFTLIATGKRFLHHH